MKIALLGLGLLLANPTHSWPGSNDRERLDPIDVDPRAALTIWYPGDPKQLPWQPGPPFRPSIAVIEGDRVPISRSPDGACPRVQTELTTYPEDVPLEFEEDGQHLWSPASTSQMSEHVDSERCEVVIDEARSQIQWERVPITYGDARVRKLMEEGVLTMPVDVPPESP